MFKEKFTLKEMIYISLLATIATVSKVPVRALSNVLTSSIGLPGGIVGGVYYMFWIVAATRVVNKHGAATLFCIIQIFVSIATSSMPIIKLITYLPPGIVIDLFLILQNKKDFNKGTMIILGALANSAGAVSMAFSMNIPFVVVLASIPLSAISGGAGGYLAYLLTLRIGKFVEIGNN